MRREQVAALSTLLAMLLIAVIACAQDDDEVRRELDAQYKRLAEAHEKEDLEAIVGMKTADFHGHLPRRQGGRQ